MVYLKIYSICGVEVGVNLRIFIVVYVFLGVFVLVKIALGFLVVIRFRRVRGWGGCSF